LLSADEKIITAGEVPSRNQIRRYKKYLANHLTFGQIKTLAERKQNEEQISHNKGKTKKKFAFEQLRLYFVLDSHNDTSIISRKYKAALW